MSDLFITFASFNRHLLSSASPEGPTSGRLSVSSDAGGTGSRMGAPSARNRFFRLRGRRSRNHRTDSIDVPRTL